MSTKRTTKVISFYYILATILFVSGCGPESLEPTQTPLPTSTELFTPTFTVAPTLTPTFTLAPTLTPTFTLTPVPTATPTDSPTPRPTSIPGTLFEITTEDLTLKLEVPSCDILSIGLPHDGPTINPLPSDDKLCVMPGEILAGSPTQSQMDNWVNSGGVYLLNLEGRKGQLVYATANTSKRTIYWIFSTPNGYTPAQLQMLDGLFELP